MAAYMDIPADPIVIFCYKHICPACMLAHGLKIPKLLAEIISRVPAGMLSGKRTIKPKLN